MSLDERSTYGVYIYSVSKPQTAPAVKFRTPREWEAATDGSNPRDDERVNTSAARSSTRRSTLTRERVLQAAVDLADNAGHVLVGNHKDEVLLQLARYLLSPHSENPNYPTNPETPKPQNPIQGY